MKTILALVTDAYGGSGGIAQANRDLLEALSQKFNILVLPRKSKEPLGVLPKNIRQEPAVINRFLYTKKAFQISGREKIDFIFCGHLFMAPAARIISKARGIPYWVCLYGIDAWERPSRIIQKAVDGANLVTSISRFTRRKFLSWAAISPDKVKILPVTYHEVFRPGPKPEKLIQRYGLQEKKILLTVGRLSPLERYKGHDKVIEALPKIVEQCPEVVYVIAGDGGDKSRLETLAKEKGVSDKVFFIGYIPEEELPALYRMADVFVMPSAGEGFGIVFLEAAASGIPVVGGREDGSVDALAEGKIGRVVETKNARELEQTILDSLRLPRAQNEEVKRFSRPHYSAHALKIAEKMSAAYS